MITVDVNQPEETKEEKKEQKPKTPPPQIVAKNGVLTPTNLDEAWRLASAYCMSGFLPRRFDTPEKVLAGMQLAQELGLKPLTALRQIAVIHGTPSVFGDLPLSLLYQSKKCEYLREYLVDKDMKKICLENDNATAEAYAGVCIAKRIGDPEVAESIFTMDDARKAGLLPAKPDAAWNTYPKRMLRYRARSQVMKDKFPDVLNGVAIAEYDFHTIPSDNDDDVKTAPVSASDDKLSALSAKIHKETPPELDAVNDSEARLATLKGSIGAAVSACNDVETLGKLSDMGLKTMANLDDMSEEKLREVADFLAGGK